MLADQKSREMIAVIGICVIGISIVSGHVSTSEEDSDDSKCTGNFSSK